MTVPPSNRSGLVLGGGSGGSGASGGGLSLGGGSNDFGFASPQYNRETGRYETGGVVYHGSGEAPAGGAAAWLAAMREEFGWEMDASGRMVPKADRVRNVAPVPEPEPVAVTPVAPAPGAAVTSEVVPTVASDMLGAVMSLDGGGDDVPGDNYGPGAPGSVPVGGQNNESGGLNPFVTALLGAGVFLL